MDDFMDNFDFDRCHENEMRSESLCHAVEYHRGSNKSEEEIIVTAKKFEMYITGKEPCKVIQMKVVP